MWSAAGAHITCRELQKNEIADNDDNEMALAFAPEAKNALQSTYTFYACCAFCGYETPEAHVYEYVISNREPVDPDGTPLVLGTYLQVCTHVEWDGNPWCDNCFMLGLDEETAVVRMSCAGCCGVSWGHPVDAQLFKRALMRVDNKLVSWIDYAKIVPGIRTYMTYAPFTADAPYDAIDDEYDEYEYEEDDDDDDEAEADSGNEG